MLKTGEEEPSLRAVARAAGVSAMAPYRHFADKADLLAAVAGHGFEALADVLIAADDKPLARDALFAQGMAFVDFARANPALFRLMFSSQYGGAGVGAAQAANAVLVRRVTELMPEQTEAATLACRSFVQGMAMLALSDRLGSTDPNVVTAAMRLFVSAFGTGLMQDDARLP